MGRARVSAVFFGVARSVHYTLQFMCIFLAEQKLRMKHLYSINSFYIVLTSQRVGK